MTLLTEKHRKNMILSAILWRPALHRCAQKSFKATSAFARVAGPLFILIAVALIGLCAHTYFSVVLPYHFPTLTNETSRESYRESPTLFTLNITWSVYMLVCITFHYFMAVFTPPGSPPSEQNNLSLRNFRANNASNPSTENCQRADDDSSSDSSNDDDLATHPTCRKCHLPKPPRTHHCSLCRKCIYRFDHHCPWIHNCVGHFNFRYFILFMLYLDVAAFYFAIMCFGPFKQALSQALELKHSGGSEMNGERVDEGVMNATQGMGPGFAVGRAVTSSDPSTVVVFAFVLSAAISIALAALASWHLFLVFRNQTTVEFYRSRYLQKVSRNSGEATFAYGKEYDRGGPLRNLQDFFNVKSVGSYPWFTVFLPIPIPPIGSGRTFVPQRSYYDAGSRIV